MWKNNKSLQHSHKNCRIKSQTSDVVSQYKYGYIVIPTATVQKQLYSFAAFYDLENTIPDIYCGKTLHIKRLRDRKCFGSDLFSM